MIVKDNKKINPIISDKEAKSTKVNLQTTDGKQFGEISASAYSAIRGDYLDKYSPVDDSEKKVLDDYKKWTGYGRTYETVKAQYDKNKFGKGNIDLTTRPVYKNADGSISTVSSMSINEDGKEVLIPTVVKDESGNAKMLTEEEAVEHYHRTGEYLGKFNTVEEADEYANSLHIDQDLYYSALPETKTKKDGFFPWIGKQAMSGLGQFNKSISSTLDFILPTEFLGRYDFISKMNDYYTAAGNNQAQEAAKSSASRGKGWDVVGEVIAGTVAALPNSVLAYMSAGASLGSQGIATGLQAGNAAAAITGNSAKQMLGNAVKTVAKNPMYWSSFLQTVGNDYEDAKASGANEFVASSTAILTSLINAGVEVAGGIETLPTSVKQGGKKAVWEWVKSSLDEGKEEVIQGIITNSIAKMAYDSDRQVFNPKESAKEFAMGAAVGGILGGAQTALGTISNNAVFEKTGKLYNDVDTVNRLIKQGMQSPKGTESRKIAENLNSRMKQGKKISNRELGKLVYANQTQIGTENTVHDETVNTVPAQNATDINRTTYNTTVDAPVTVQETQQETAEHVNQEAEEAVAEAENVVENTPEVDAVAEPTAVSVGDVFKDTKYGNTITVVERGDENTTIEIDTGKSTERRVLKNEQADTLISKGQYEHIEAPAPVETTGKRNVSLSQVGDFYEAYGEDAKALAEKLELTPTTKTVNGVSVPMVGFPVSSLADYQQKTGYDFSVVSVMERNPLSNQEKKVFSYDKEGKIRFKQTDINYENSKYRDDTFNVMVQGKAEIETLQGGIVGKYGVHGKNNGYIGVTLLSSGMDIAAFKTADEAIDFATYANRTIPFNDVSYVRNGEGVLTIDATPEFMKYGEQIKAIKSEKAYLQTATDTETSETVTSINSENMPVTDQNITDNDTVTNTNVSKAEVAESVTESSESGINSQKAEEIAPVSDDTVRETENSETPVAVKNTTADANTSLETKAATSKTSETPSDNNKTMTKTDKKVAVEKSIAKKKKPVTKQNKAKITDFSDFPKVEDSLKEGQTLTLKHTRNLHTVFKDATRVAVGKDVITDGYIAIPRSDEAVSKIKKVVDESIIQYGDLTFEKIYKKDSDVVISGVPKITDKIINGKKEKVYVFKIGNEFYTCQQKHLDALNDGNNTFVANKDANSVWTVKDENGEVIAAIVPAFKKGSISDEIYDRLDSVADVINAKNLKKAKMTQATLSQEEMNYFGNGNALITVNVDGVPFLCNNYLLLRTDEYTIDLMKEEYERDITLNDSFAERAATLFSQDIIGDVTKTANADVYKTDYNGKVAISEKTGKPIVEKSLTACLADDTPFCFDTKMFNMLDKASDSLKIIKFTDSLETSALIGFDESGEIVGYLCPVRGSANTAVEIDGKQYKYYTKGSIDEKMADTAETDDLKNEEKSAIIEKDKEAFSETDEAVRSVSEYTKDMKPMQKGKVEKALHAPYQTKEYGLLTYADFMERSIADGRQLEERRDLKAKVRNEHNEFSYSKGLEASYNKHISDYRAKGVNRFDLTIEAKDLKDGVGAGKNIKAVDPELYYHLTGDESVLPENSYDKTYCVMQDGNTFYSVPKTAYDYGLWLQKQADTEEASFSLESVIEEEKDLIAIHNISPEKLKSTIELGGLPMPSIAVTRANELFSKFGTISILFNKDTIDPKNKRNKVYSGDAYTPTFPQIDYRASNDVLKQVRDKVYSLVGGSSVADELDHLHLDTDNVQHTLGRYDGDVVQGFADNATLKYAFLKDRKADVKLPTKEKPLYRYGEVPNRDVVAFAHKLTNGLQSANELLGLNSRDLMANTELKDAIAQVLNDGVVANVDKNSDRYQALLENPLYKADELDLSMVLGMLEAAQRYFSGGSQLTTTIDSHSATKVLNEYLKSNNLESDYHAWIRQLFDGVVAQKGIRNNLDTFTPSGNRRSFNALHHELNLENIVKAMRSGAKQGISVFGGSIFGGSTIPYGSIAEIKNNKNRLKAIDVETYDNQRKEFSDRFYDIARKYVIHSDGVWGAQEVLVEAVVKCKTKDGLKTYLQREGKGWARNFDEVTDDLISLVNDIRQMPTEYFEAKPERVVGFDEIVAFVVPDNLDADLRSSIEDLGAEVVTYDHTDKSGNSRLDAINSVEDVKFSTENRKGVSNNEKGRSDTLPRSVGRGVSKSAGKSSRGVSETASGIEESSRQGTDTESSRRIYAENVRAVQGTEVRQQGPFQCEFINPEHYTDEMKAIEQTNKERGIKNTYFFFGDGKVAFKNKVIFRGAIAKGDIYIRCDHPKYSPAQINRHEYVHHKYKTEDVTKVRNYINKHLTNAEKEHIINVMYARYALVCKGDVDLIFQEFVCDVLADMNDYGVVFRDIADAYWSDNTDLIDSYTAADYAESIDAGGVAFSSKEYADTFYSQMAKVVDAIKQEKIGAASVVSYLKGRGVKDEEIKWSGIEDWLSGKKSVTKAELLDFIKNSTLQIETTVLSDENINYTEDESKSLAEIEEITSEKWSEIATLWDEAFNEKFPLDVMLAENPTAALGKKLTEKISVNDNSGIPEKITNLAGEILTLNNNRDFIVRRASARSKDMRPHWGLDSLKLAGGTNYRELLFKLPNSDYSNYAMDTHWKAPGVLAHARVQDLNDADGDKVLFIEELQSDWHNEGAKKGYRDKKLQNASKLKLGEFNNDSGIEPIAEVRDENGNLYAYIRKASSIRYAVDYANGTYFGSYNNLVDAMNELNQDAQGQEFTVPDAPFRNTYHEFVLKNLLRMAAEQGYGKLAWTTGKMQESRWSSDYAEAYRIEYDQNIPKFLNKYGKKWGAKVGRTKVYGGWDAAGNAPYVPAIAITDDMRESVLYEGQPIYSLADKNTYDHTKPFSEQLDDWAKGLVPQNDSLTVGATPKVLQQIGFNPLPVTINQEHIDYAVNGTKDTDHYISKNVLAQLPQALEAPVAVIRSQSTPTRAVAILSLTNPQNGKQVIVPFEIDGSGRQNNIRIDTNAITTIFGKSNALVQMKNAIETDSNNDNKLFYWNKKEAVSLLQRAGLHLSGGLPQDGFIHSIRDKGSKVKWKFNNVTETQQFKRWFGKSKIVNADGTPKVMYHGSNATFSVFDVNKAKASGYYGKGFYFTDSESHASTYGKLYPAYLSVQMPLEYGKNKISKNQIIAFLEAVAENEDYSIENYGTYDISEIMSRITSTDAFSVIQDINATAIGDMVEAVKLFNSINSTKFDGIITPTETIVFEPTQIKSATDNIGTFDSENPDIYYSLDEDGEPDLFDIWKSKVDEFGAIPKGEKPARDIDVPEKIDKDKLVSRFARTMLEAGITPDTAVSEFEKRVLDGTMTHEVVTNDAAREWAVNQIKYHGFEEALNSWEVYTRDGNVGKKELALGMELYNQCITNGDVTNAMKIAAELVAEATHAGQTLQATRMLKLMTPDGQLYYLEKSIQKMNDEFKKKIGDKYEDIELNEDLMGKFLTEKDADKRDEIYDDICQNIADQIPATLLDKWNSWRYLAMLGNARTHIRNIAGNAVFVPAIKLKNYIGAAIETAAKVDAEKRTKSLHKNKDAVDFAKKDFRKMQKVLQGENAKYAVTSDIEGKRTIFKTKWLESLRNKNFEWLEKEDMWFLEKHYVDALAQIITARKLDVNNIDEKTLDIARAYAVREAQRATYRDANSLAEALNKLQKKAEHSDKKAIRATNLLIEGVMPFKKTPLNIAKQGVQYSPIGILSGIYKIADKVKGGKAYSTTDIIDDFAKGLTGTAIMLLGTLLASLGIISGGADDNKKKKEFDKMVGEQAFSLNIGDSSYTIDWMTPACLPLFTGVELYELTKDDFKFADIVTALSSLTDPLLELSVFSGISGAIESAQYNDTNTLYAIGSDMTISYLTQALPTIGGQLSRIIDKNKREYYYTDKNSNLPKGLQNIMGQAASKIPFASYLFEPAIDEWGREETYGNLFERAVENTVSPGYYAEKNYTAVDNEIKRLYESTGDASVLPVIQQKKYTEAKVDYPMTAEQYSEAKRIRGQKSFALINNLIKSNKYKSMSDVEKAAAVAKCYREAGEYAKEQMINRVKRNK